MRRRETPRENLVVEQYRVMEQDLVMEVRRAGGSRRWRSAPPPLPPRAIIRLGRRCSRLGRAPRARTLTMTVEGVYRQLSRRRTGLFTSDLFPKGTEARVGRVLVTRTGGQLGASGPRHNQLGHVTRMMVYRDRNRVYGWAAARSAHGAAVGCAQPTPRAAAHSPAGVQLTDFRVPPAGQGWVGPATPRKSCFLQWLGIESLSVTLPSCWTVTLSDGCYRCFYWI